VKAVNMPNTFSTAFQAASPLGRAVFPPPHLRRAAGLATACHLSMLALMIFTLHRIIPLRGLMAGSAAAVMVLAAVHGLLWRRLSANRPAGSSVIAPRLGAANRISLLRGLLISLTAGFLFFLPQGETGAAAVAAWLPGGLYLTAAVLDGIDGAWARRTRTSSPLGQFLDVNIDALGVLVACAVATGTGRLPAYYPIAGLAYYLYQFGLWRRRCRGKCIHPAGSRRFARLVAGFQMGFLGVALLPIFTPAALAIAAPVFLLPLLAGFVWDWGIVQGRIDDRAGRLCTALMAALTDKAPLALRVAILLAGGGAFFGVPPFSFSTTGMLLAPILALLVVVGFLGRTAALLLSLLLAWQASVSGASPFLAAALCTTLVLLLTGTGDASLWRPEDDFLLRMPGGPDGQRAAF
jgi:phosphatidylglycerophosphate synthase